MTPPPTLQDLIATVQADAASEEALAQLSVAATTAAELEDVSDSLLSHFVDRCRKAGHTWTEISAALGVSKQAAHKRFTPGAMQLDRLTERARNLLENSVIQAGRLGHNYVGTEHVLLALLDDPESLAARLLADMGVTQEKVETEVLKFVKRGDGSHSRVVPFTPRAAALVGGAISEALQLGHNYVGTEHILLALFLDQDAVAAKALAALGVKQDAVWANVVEMLSGFTKP
ncbi:MAG: Clp protease N-terminal domain-containing protein [Actinomycetota bacterium]|nr:Clp protease N-terminal domain-containing protein [Actinomycetota bacterium]